MLPSAEEWLGLINAFKSPLASVSSALTVVGAVVVLYKGLRVILSTWTIFRTFVLARCGFGIRLTSLGSWAVVTGATDGIGKAYAVQMAQKGMNIVLISRSTEKLNKVAREIEAESGVRTKCITIDFTGGEEIYDKIAEELREIKDIGVLVNNVGIATGWPDYFLNVASNQILHDVINVNCKSVTLMTKIVLPGMIDRGKGAIINISAQIGTCAIPTLAVYAATKAYIDSFSQSIASEVKYHKGIIVQTVLPGMLSTTMTNTRPLPLIPSAPDWVRSSLATLGVQERTPGSFGHNIFWGLLELPKPAFLHRAIVIQYMKCLAVQVKAGLQEQQRLKSS